MTLEIGEDKLIKITYGAIIFTLATGIGFMGWLSSMEFRTQANAAELIKVEEANSKIEDYLYSIDKRLSRIEVLLENKNAGP